MGTTGDPTTGGPGSGAIEGWWAGSVLEPHTAQNRNFDGFSAPHVPHVDAVGICFCAAGSSGMGAAAGTSGAAMTGGSGSGWCCVIGASEMGGANENDGASGRERRADSGPAADGAFNRLPQS